MTEQEQAGLDRLLEADGPIDDPSIADITRVMKEGRGIRLTVDLAPAVFMKTFDAAGEVLWEPGPDTVEMCTEESDIELTLNGEPVRLVGPLRIKTTCPATLWPSDDGLVLHARRADGKPGIFVAAKFNDQGASTHELHQAIRGRNARLGLTQLAGIEPDKLAVPIKAPDFMVHTDQGTDALMTALADGKEGRYWHTDEQAGTHRHRRPNSPFEVVMALTEAERQAGIGPILLEDMTRAMTTDGALAMLYVCRLLVPPSPLPPNAYHGGWIDLDDVAARVWPVRPRSRKERLERRKEIYSYVRWLERASCTGHRSGTYKDRDGNEIPTTIDSPIWRIMGTERPTDPCLWPELEVPLRVELVCTREWASLLTDPKTAQYLPFAERLGAIPADKPSGAWARSIGLALGNLWRREPRKALDGTLNPTRKELLERYPPKTGPRDVLGNHPVRVVQYWYQALRMLCDEGLLERAGEVLRSEKGFRPPERQGWADSWLDERVELKPGPDMAKVLADLASARPPDRPRELRGTQAKRPRRKPAE